MRTTNERTSAQAKSRQIFSFSQPPCSASTGACSTIFATPSYYYTVSSGATITVHKCLDLQSSYSSFSAFRSNFTVSSVVSEKVECDPVSRGLEF